MCKIACEGKLFVCDYSGNFPKKELADNIAMRCQRYKMNKKVLFIKFQPLKPNNIKNKSVVQLAPSSVTSRPTYFDLGRVVTRSKV